MKFLDQAKITVKAGDGAYIILEVLNREESIELLQMSFQTYYGGYGGSCKYPKQ